MRFVQYLLRTDPTKREVGLRVGQEIINLKTIKTGLPNTLLELLTHHGDFLEELEKVKLNEIKDRIPMDQVKLLAPILNPDKVVCVGMNYKDHCEEQNVPVPVEPILFSKFASSITGPNEPIRYPSITKELDFEVELAFVIGKKGKDIPLERALDHVFGYTVAHDVSARDWQLKKNGGQWLLGKTIDDFCPIGPEIVTRSELPDPHVLPIRCRVNGVTEQDSNTDQMVHRVDAIVSYLSKFCTLLPGDIVLTGTPPGVGVFRKPPLFLKKGDVVECEIDGIGTIRNEII